MSILEEDGFVLVSKEGLAPELGAREDDIVSIGSSSSGRSSLCLVEDPSLEGLVVGSDDDEPQPQPQPEEPQPALAPADAAAVHAPAAPLAPPPPVVPAVVTQPAPAPQPAVPQPQPKYVCTGCRSDVAARADTIWEGYMGANKAAFLFKKVLNTEPAAAPRKQQLSTGLFLLQDVHCKTCAAPLGWSYLKAWEEEQKYKEGATIVQQSLLQLVREAAP